MIHDRQLARDLAEAGAAADPRATESQLPDWAGWFAFAVALALFALMAVQGWQAA